MKKKKITKLYLALIIISGVLLISSIVLIFKAKTLNNNLSSKYYSYQVLKDTNYQVLLNPNTFYDDNKLPEGLYYPSQAIDKYLLTFKYDLKTLKSKINYQYNLTADLVGVTIDNQDEKEIWKKSFLLKADSEVKTSLNNLTIKTNLEIPYHYYLNFVKDYEKFYGMKITATLDIKLNIWGKVLLKNEKEFKDDINIKISLGDTISNITKNYKEETSKSLKAKSSLKEKQMLIIGISFLTSSLLIIVYLLTKIYLTKDLKSKLFLKNILHDYEYLIVKVKEKPNLKDLKIIKVFKLEDLINIAKLNNTNILYFEIFPNKKQTFYVIINHYVYLYNLVLNN